MNLLYMLYPSWLSPVMIQLGSFPIRWYSMGYVFAFITTYILAKQIHKKDPFITEQQMSDMFVNAIVGLLIGARLFYVVFYNLEYFLDNPLSIIWPFDGIPFFGGKFIGIEGLSYHGGAIGAMVGLILYARKHKIEFFRIADLWSAVIPFGYTFGRLGNFANAELYGKATTSSLGMIFPDAKLFSIKYGWVRDMAQDIGIELTGAYVNLPRHPSQLYEALFEGIVLGLILLFVIKPRVKAPGQVFASYLIGYSVVRFFIEYLREPDEQVGYILAFGDGAETPGVFVSFLNFSMGQGLSFVMILIGFILYYILGRRATKVG
ncbi:prolipoprotein diacylglyceryl transferase [Entomospira nematocerorum]|uniref:Phosphatidylglycerol--prolipoprotein diacylglyceryl transferase n=1 Tax=Entomospira nematocerorum TaxID=2719987 RepID=A0A968GDI5_9SPIO|nr:prolipoprotein diacylglyceryl transferase [Entomospira nematocera]NIZ47082.1 prolipoprotein diacylglyceryl transferase [Entomospira nematocera]WDI34373.1 prolipoprotein diacylglyceryl transferase [Entomospira nematocera]